ncbi:MAG: tRNA (adenosine(37)-N6)-threonylcarbamoyltransferase complex ATPase subunit type 1 TsaE [Alphaproteobacteria bacterium]
MECLIASPESMDGLARKIARLAARGDVIALSGELGTGKTRFARAFIRARLGRDEDVPSPTFTLAQRYGQGQEIIWHFDLYRLDSPGELDELGMEDAAGEAIVLIEWPERLDRSLSPHGLEIRIAFADQPEARRVSLRGRGRWEDLIAELTWP